MSTTIDDLDLVLRYRISQDQVRTLRAEIEGLQMALAEQIAELRRLRSQPRATRACRQQDEAKRSAA